MRILHVRFKNLNSLAGQWEIDLSDPSFTADGIFAIVGPTGSGKTTILDAICLALYGRTPRLTRVTKSGNEIMSRQTGECFAEVTFATQAGRYRCHWSQHRARRRPDGELQAPRHEIADADSGAIFETKMRGVAEQIETATGMDFDRFTRSMMLAQGGFAAFLQAAPDERAPILEQITGSEIYSRISIRVHERRQDERKKLDTVQAELAGMNLLSKEQEQQLVAGLEQKVGQDTALSDQLAEATRTLNWLDEIERLVHAGTVIRQQKEDLQQRIDSFAPEQERLHRAVAALELTGEYATLVSLRGAQEADRNEWQMCRETLPSHLSAAQLTTAAASAAGKRCEARKAEQQQELPVIRTTRELDLTIREKETALQTAVEAVAEKEQTVAALRQQQQQGAARQETTQRLLAEVQRYLEENKVDEGLVESLSEIRGRFETLRTLQRQQIDTGKEAEQAEQALHAAIERRQAQAETLAATRRERDVRQQALADKRTELTDLLAGRDVSGWRDELTCLMEQKNVLVRLEDAVSSLTVHRQAVEHSAQRQQALKAEQAALAEQLQQWTGKEADLEEQVRQLDDRLSLLKRIENFADARPLLKDGEPCPLCGAREHPFAKGEPPAADEVREKREALRSEYKAALDARSRVQIEQARVGKDLEQLAVDVREHEKSIKEAEALINEIGAAVELDAAADDLTATIKQLRAANAAAVQQVSVLVKQADGIEKACGARRDALDQAREAVTAGETDYQAAVHQSDTARRQLEYLTAEIGALERQLQRLLDSLRADVRLFGIETVSIDSAEQVQVELTERRDRWLARLQEQRQRGQELAALDMQNRHRAELIEAAAREWQTLNRRLELLETDRDTLCRKRQELFGDKSPEQEEKRLTDGLEAADQELVSARQQQHEADRELGRLQARLESLAGSLAQRESRLSQQEAAFRDRLIAAGFADERGFNENCLPEDQRAALSRQAQALADEKTRLMAKERDTLEQLEKERSKQLSDQPREEIGRRQAELVAAQKAIQQEIGGIRQQLAEDARLKETQRQRLLLAAARQREWERWDRLHGLIGSADGKKYRNFAQGLTFELMVGHANRQLQKMSDRYLLIRDRTHPLELSVIDNYQAGEIRSTKNLSGGESFLVSLALALGLSQMASDKVRVDSLFLDEGFGTLDDEVLDMALETLASLQQDGKLIGVISHVPALKERIAARIEVIPRTGGRSRIVGPGCRRCEAG
ncbi:AAA family ATPase [Desulfofustis glycolicus]|uniref:Exonuclease SbcC n=1 Tax=Desulfofustis glycolicus DSM 9705 TaxID=1121409 RepID=A0A1M5YBE7_9BACT|nr:AAA family ATPase [Desulfofustis glycolicus]MCB2217733.1 AAA family ATPase [Desulfobulbaceae bacterium]SHI09365.1 exonuclease SbcC [Desulfofustis glycolicus DSM 9705]